MNILFTSDHYTPSINGIVTHILLLRNELTKRGHNVYILTARRPDSANEKNVIYTPSVNFPLHKADQIPILFTPQVTKKLKDIKIDIIHNHLFGTAIMGMSISRKQNVPLLATYHILFQTYAGWVMPKIIARPFTYVMGKLYFKYHDLVIAPSQKAEKDLLRVLPQEKVKIVPNGINFPDENSVNEANFLKRFGLSKTDKLVITPGRVDVGKNVDLSLKAFSLALKKLPTIKLVIAGDGPLRPKMERLAGDLGIKKSVVFTGALSQAEIFEAYKASFCVLFTSTADILPTVIIEALSLKKPVVSVKEDAISSLVINNKTGLLSDISPESLSKNLLKLLTDEALYKKISLQCASHAKAFSIEKNVDNLLLVYKELINKRRE